jgi:2-C-methyl-D-erythritol 4-phosphate cytidylyltransferase
MEKSIIITAGGIGKRMGGTIPKQFLVIKEKPILMHTLLRFFEYDPTAQIILTLPVDWHAYWDDLVRELNFEVPHLLIAGGEERFHSIQNALKIASGKWIAVHDGVRPLVSQQTIANTFDLAKTKGTAVPVLAIHESVRYVKEKETKALNRNDYKLVQTPQVFERSILMRAYECDFHTGITDDASLVESSGFPIFLTEGNEENIKITRPIDLKIAAVLFT